MTSEKDQETKRNIDKGTGISMGVGIALGVALGAALGNMAIGLVLGIAVGAAGGAIKKRQSIKKNRIDLFQGS